MSWLSHIFERLEAAAIYSMPNCITSTMLEIHEGVAPICACLNEEKLNKRNLKLRCLVCRLNGLLPIPPRTRREVVTAHPSAELCSGGFEKIPRIIGSALFCDPATAQSFKKAITCPCLPRRRPALSVIFETARMPFHSCVELSWHAMLIL